MSKLLVVLNPYSGRGRAGESRARLEAALNRAGLQYEIAETEGPNDGIRLAREGRLNGYEIVAAAGGDGTVSEVMNGLAQAANPDEPVATLGLLPLGSGNDFADMVGCPSDLNEAAAVIAAGTIRPLDLGRVTIEHNEGETLRYFDNNMGIGFEARVTLESYRIKRLQGTPLYVAAVLRTLRQFHAPELDIRCVLEDGREWVRKEATLLLTIGNSPRTGAGFYLTPDAVMDDGLLDVGIATDIPVWRTFILLPKTLFGKHTTDSAVTMLRCTEVRVRAQEGIPVQLDGEVVTEAATAIDVAVQPQRLHLLAAPS